MKAWHCIATVPAFFILRLDDRQTAKHAIVHAPFADPTSRYAIVHASFADLIASYSRKRGFDDALQAMYSRKRGFDGDVAAPHIPKTKERQSCHNPTAQNF